MGQDQNVGKKDDAEKLRYDLIPLDAEEQVVRVLMHGAKKYGDDNWKLVPEANRRYYAAFLRHVKAWRRGQELDPESGLHHLAHAVCSLLFLLEGPEPVVNQPADPRPVVTLPSPLPAGQAFEIKVDPSLQVCPDCSHALAHHHLNAGCWVARRTPDVPENWSWCPCSINGPLKSVTACPSGVNPDGTPFKPEASA